MKSSRFRVSHLITSVLLISFGAFVGYLIIFGLIDFNASWMIILYIPILCLGAVLPIVSGFALIISDIQNIRAGESTAIYEEPKDS